MKKRMVFFVVCLLTIGVASFAMTRPHERPPVSRLAFEYRAPDLDTHNRAILESSLRQAPTPQSSQHWVVTIVDREIGMRPAPVATEKSAGQKRSAD